ncbi:MAG: hypothetical protein JWM11_1025 [Planctomycetaceae bacterium]|nr:hypothetical protein [Planctomycetaceae bacterium]
MLRHNRRSFFSLVPFVIVGLLSVCAGCGSGYPSPLPVSGTVTFEGKPVTDGSIRFMPTDRKVALPGFAEIQTDGTYEAMTHRPGDGLTPGEFTIFFDLPESTDKLKPVKFIPQKYLSPGTSGLKREIKGDTQDFKLD